ncbi:MAG: T9SS type A sorting domain-containing protein [Saprospiraceae bacterium]|nr:T9SS type A sorting domain-containing protein [Saprospiraceae bacterium]
MNLKKLFVLMGLLCLCLSANTQTIIYLEDFTGQNGKGAVGPGNSIDVTDVDWTVNIDDANLTASSDYFRVENGVFEARDIDGTQGNNGSGNGAVWISPSINITGFSDVTIEIDVDESGTFEDEDFIRASYQLDGGAVISFGEAINDFNAQTFSVSGLSGSNLVIYVEVDNNAGGEYHQFDNVQVSGTGGSGCGVTGFGTEVINCTTITAGPDNDFVEVSLDYFGQDANAVTTILVDGFPENNFGDDPASVNSGTIQFAAYEGANWSVNITGGSCGPSTSGTVGSSVCEEKVCVEVIGFNSDNPDEILLRAQTDIPANTVYYLTDNEWNSGSEVFNSGENIVSWTSPGFVLGSGSTVLLSGSSATCGSLSGNTPALSTSGEEIYVTRQNPSGTVIADDICFAVLFGGTGDIDGLEAVDLGNVDNGRYNSGAVTNAGSWNTSSSRLTLSPGNCSNLIFPIELRSFNAQLVNKQVKLTWQTASETNNDYMVVERRTANAFEAIGQVAGAGTTEKRQSYEWMDSNPAPGTNYYRLKQVDFDGEYEYHRVVSVEVGSEQTTRLWPNPVTNHLYIHTDASVTEIQVVDVLGQQVEVEMMENGVNMALLPQGVYYVVVKTTRSKDTFQVIKR